MADALVSIILDKLTSIVRQQMEAEVQLVVGVKHEVLKLAGNFQVIQAVLEDAEKKQFNEPAVRAWIDKLKDACYDIDDVLDEWSTAILEHQIEGVYDKAPAPRKVSFSFSFKKLSLPFRQVSLGHNIDVKIKELNKRLDVIAQERENFRFELKKSSGKEVERPISTALIDVSEVIGRDSDKTVIIDQLLCEEKDFHVISIVGLGGIGKTALAQLAYNDDRVTTRFQLKIWVPVFDSFDEVKIAKAILRELQGSSPTINELKVLHKQIHDLVRKKKLLLILDDVWIEDNSQRVPLKLSFMSGIKGSTVLVTTCNERVAKLMGSTYTHNLMKLSEDDCWSLFKNIACFESREGCENLEKIRKKIVERCDGLPFVAKSLGSLMHLKDSREVWQVVLDSEVWKRFVVDNHLYAPLLLSYYKLPPKIKILFSYCAVFPKDTEIQRDDLVQLWMAQGYFDSEENSKMEIKGRDYFENLAMHSFFRDIKMDEVDGSIIRCKMHNVVHDLAQVLTQNECIIMENDNANKLGKESSSILPRHASITGHLSSSLSFPNTKKLRTLLFHSRQDDLGAIDLCDRLSCIRALDISICSLKKIPRGVEKLIHMRYLNLSENKDLKELPEEVCELCNLQTLKLNWCESVDRLPQGIGKLISLRCLEIEGTVALKVLPKGIGRLSCLRTLSKFIVSDDCKIGELRSLNHLQGNLRIEGLEKVRDVKEVELKNKNELRGLTLCFNDEVMGYKPLEVLQPPSQLESLSIFGYGGIKLSTNWIIFSSNLKLLHLQYFHNCECLLHLGRLSSLEDLTIQDMRSIKRVGVEFLGIEQQERPFISFPKLKELNFRDMWEWEEWEWITITSAKDKIPIIMPCLRSLALSNCRKLKALPDHFLKNRSFEKDKINGCPFVEQQLKKIGKGTEVGSSSYIRT